MHTLPYSTSHKGQKLGERKVLRFAGSHSKTFAGLASSSYIERLKKATAKNILSKICESRKIFPRLTFVVYSVRITFCEGSLKLGNKYSPAIVSFIENIKTRGCYLHGCAK